MFANLRQSATDIDVRPHARARRLRLRVDPATGRAVLTVPRHTRQSVITAFLNLHAGWVAEQRRRLPAVQAFVPGAVIMVAGQPVTLQHNAAHRGKALLANGTLTMGGHLEHFTRRTEDALKDLAKNHCTQLASALAAELGVKVKDVTIRDPRARWGSCSSTGRLSLSWRLILAPPLVCRYVVAHEVAHLREMNHSQAFWALVNQLVGDYRPARRWLAQHGAALLRMGVADS